jgi:hypothetical protein
MAPLLDVFCILCRQLKPVSFCLFPSATAEEPGRPVAIVLEDAVVEAASLYCLKTSHTSKEKFPLRLSEYYPFSPSYMPQATCKARYLRKLSVSPNAYHTSDGVRMAPSIMQCFLPEPGVLNWKADTSFRRFALQS